MANYVVGVAKGFYDEHGQHTLSALRESFLDLPLDCEVVVVNTDGAAVIPGEALNNVDFFVMGGGRFAEASLVGNDRLMAVCRWGVGYDNVDLVDAAHAGVVVTNAPEGVKKAMAQTAIAFVLALAHRIFDQDRAMRQGESWSVKHRHIGPGLVGKKLGVIGLGNIGQEIVRIASVLDCEILGFDPYAKNVPSNVRLVDLPELMRESDFIIVQCALTPDTEGLISAELIASMKPTANIVNTARGPIIDEAALTTALREKRIAGAALDVFRQEPINPDNELLTLDNVIVTPHSAGWTDYFARTTAESVSNAIRAVLNGELPVNTVNRRQLEETGTQPRFASRLGN